MKPAGYLIKQPGGLQGERGAVFDYVLGSNGVFVESEGELMAARVQAAWVPVKGLAPLEPMVVLRYGLIPKHIWYLALSVFLAEPEEERYVAITCEHGFYHLMKPSQEGKSCHVKYSCVDNTVVELHSHGRLGPFFSPGDDGDEQGFRIYGVVGHCDEIPRVMLRVGVYGYHNPVSWSQVFQGNLRGVLEGPKEEREVKDELYDKCQPERGCADRRHRSWWNRVIRGGEPVPDSADQSALDLSGL